MDLDLIISTEVPVLNQTHNAVLTPSLSSSTAFNSAPRLRSVGMRTDQALQLAPTRFAHPWKQLTHPIVNGYDARTSGIQSYTPRCECYPLRNICVDGSWRNWPIRRLRQTVCGHSSAPWDTRDIMYQSQRRLFNPLLNSTFLISIYLNYTSRAKSVMVLLLPGLLWLLHWLVVPASSTRTLGIAWKFSVQGWLGGI